MPLDRLCHYYVTELCHYYVTEYGRVLDTGMQCSIFVLWFVACWPNVWFQWWYHLCHITGTVCVWGLESKLFCSSGDCLGSTKLGAVPAYRDVYHPMLHLSTGQCSPCRCVCWCPSHPQYIFTGMDGIKGVNLDGILCCCCCCYCF